jgi:D-3-phosphoglycerate dehydrogenase
LEEKMKVMICDPLANEAIEMLKDAGLEVVEMIGQTPEELTANIKDYDAVIVRSATTVRQPSIDAADKLKAIARGGIGLDNIDVEYAKSKGIAVLNTPAASTRSVAELAIAHMFAMARFITPADRTMRDGKWEKKKMKGIELAGKTLGLLGYGRIGQETGRIADVLGMTVIGWDKYVEKSPVDFIERVEFDDILARSDFISLHIPFIKADGPTLSAAEFAKMKDGVYLVNCARGGTVEEKALLDALTSGKVAKAAIDVFEKEPAENNDLINHPNVNCTPHIGASTVEGQSRVGTEVAQKVIDALKK